MTVTLAGSPGALPAWESQKFSATVNGVAALVYARTQDMHLDSDSPYLTIDTPSEQSFLKFTYNEAVTIVVSTVDEGDPILSANVYPVRDDVTLTVAGGAAMITLPVDTDGVDLWFECNDDRQNVLHIFAQPPLDGTITYTSWTDVGSRTVSSIDPGTNVITFSASHEWEVGQEVHFYSEGTYPTASGGDIDPLVIYFVESVPLNTQVTLSRTNGGAAIDLTGAGSGVRTVTQASWTNSASALYFPAGFHRIGMLFRLADDTEVYLAHRAVVEGSFDLRDTDGVFIHGPGVLSGAFAESQVGQPFADIVPYAMFYGYGTGKFEFDNRVEGITVVSNPAFVNFYGLWSVRFSQVLCPWEANSDGYSLLRKSLSDQRSEQYRCYAYLGDDATHIENPIGTVTLDKCFFICSANGSPFLLSYTKKLVTGDYTQTISDCHAMTLAGPDPDTFDEWPYRGFSSIFKLWTDAETNGLLAAAVTTFDTIDVWGPLQSRLVTIQAIPYEFVGPALGRGQVKDIVFNNVTVHDTPGQPSVIDGLDFVNCPHEIYWRNLVIDEVPVTVRNYTDYFLKFTPYANRIFFGDRAVVTAVEIVNTALSYVGERDRVTSLDPLDGSEEARHGARAYTEAFQELLEMHTWSFTLKKTQLTVVNEDADDTDDPAWDYRYEIPEGMAEAIAVLPDEHTEDYVVGALKAPQDFHIKLSDEDNTTRIYTRVPDAWLRYTVYTTDPNQGSRLFIAALTWLVASKLAGTVVRGETGESMKLRCLAMFGKYLGEARTRDARQRQVNAKPATPWVAARGGANPWDSRMPHDD